MQTASKVFMVKPLRFGANTRTDDGGTFSKAVSVPDAQTGALREFMSFISLLKANGVDVVVAEDTVLPHTSDSIFPGDWFSAHSEGILVLYPMASPNRRSERKSEFIDVLRKNFDIRRVVDLTHWAEDELYLEGTGSMVLDRDARVAYVCRSSRSSEAVSADFCKQMGYTQVVFDAVGPQGEPVLHTDTMMSIGTEHAFVCIDAIKSAADREAVASSLKRAGKSVIAITPGQMSGFLGNVRELHNAAGRRFLVMSGRARKCLLPAQVRELGASYRILSPELDTIEEIGGGSAGSMMACLY